MRHDRKEWNIERWSAVREEWRPTLTARGEQSLLTLPKAMKMVQALSHVIGLPTAAQLLAHIHCTSERSIYRIVNVEDPTVPPIMGAVLWDGEEVA